MRWTTPGASSRQSVGALPAGSALAGAPVATADATVARQAAIRTFMTAPCALVDRIAKLAIRKGLAAAAAERWPAIRAPASSQTFSL